MYKIAIIGAYSAAYFGIVGIFAAVQKARDLKRIKAFKIRAARRRARVARSNWAHDLIECSREFSAWVRTPRLNPGKEE